MPEAAYIQLRCRPPEDEQGNAQKMWRILINISYLLTPWSRVLL
jgi:hypothetical protein